MSEEKIEHPYEARHGSSNQCRSQGNYRQSPGDHAAALDNTHGQHGRGTSTLERTRTAGSIAISPEIFEKLYLTPENRVHGDLRKTLGNPTPIAILGFVICLTPLCMDLMGWRGAGQAGAAQVASYYFIGGLFHLIAAIMEFLLGNTFPFVVFTAYSGFWFTFGGTLTPSFNAAGAYSPDGENNHAGMQTVGFNASFGFYLLTWAFVTFIFLICSLRTNAAYFILFLFLDALFGILTGVYFSLADGDVNKAHHLLVVAGAFGLISCLSGWYIFIAQILAALDFPIQLPVGDLSNIIISRSTRRAMEPCRAGVV